MRAAAAGSDRTIAASDRSSLCWEWFPGVAVQHHELVPQGQVLEQQLPARLEGCTQTPKHGKNYSEHDAPSLTEAPSGLTISIRDEMFPTHNYFNGRPGNPTVNESEPYRKMGGVCNDNYFSRVQPDLSACTAQAGAPEPF